MQRSTTLLLALSPLLTLVQASAVDGIEPAAATVPDTPAAGAPLQAAEKLQLTDEVIERLETEEATSDYAKYFKFGNGDAPAYSASCKTFPGDDAWPKDTTWDMFNVLLDGALIPTKPIAASCYDTRWGKKDAAACSDVINNFTSPLFHSADPTSSKLFPLTDFELMLMVISRYVADLSGQDMYAWQRNHRRDMHSGRIPRIRGQGHECGTDPACNQLRACHQHAACHQEHWSLLSWKVNWRWSIESMDAQHGPDRLYVSV